MPTESPHVVIALVLVVGAGAATALGAAVVFVPSLVQYANRKTLAASLGLSAGVMTYVSFVEIFRKAIHSFQLDGIPDDDAYMYATICFFGGVLLMVALNSFVARLVRGSRHHSRAKAQGAPDSVDQMSRDIHAFLQATSEMDDILFTCCSDYPIEDLEAIKYMARELEQQKKEKREAKLTARTDDDAPSSEEESSIEYSEKDEEASAGCSRDKCNVECGGEADSGKRKEDEAKLMRVSINTAVAIALHNFPEGLATFVTALHDPKVGGVLALAIAIHNIPEGLCVALPIYYATGNRWKAFGLAVCSGLSEPAAALLGWAVLANSLNNTTYAILFGLVGGMMVTISVRELLPTAHRYDPEDSIVTNSYIFGVCIMALSLVLFVI